MRGSITLLALAIAGCTGTAHLAPPVTPASSGPATPSAPVAPIRSVGPYLPPSFESPLPASLSGGWMPQTISGMADGSLPVSPGLPGEAPTAFTFDAPHGVTASVGATTQLKLTGGCGLVYWGVDDESRGFVTVDGQLRPRAPGPLLVFAQQQERRRYLEVAVTADPPPAARFGPPTGFVLASANAEDRVDLIQDSDTFDAWWSRRVEATQGIVTIWGSPVPTPVPSPPVPHVDFDGHSVLAIDITLQDDEADPVVTHVDADGVHLVVPDASPGEPTFTRRFVGLYRLAQLSPDVRVSMTRRILDRPLPVGVGPRPAASPSPEPIRPTGMDCPPAWVWHASPRDVWLDAGDQTDANGFPVPAPTLALAVGRSLHLVGRSSRGPIAWSVSDPTLAHIDSTFAIPRAWPGPGASSAPGDPYGVVLSANAPGAVVVTASAGGERARAVIASVSAPPPALVFRFRQDPSPPADMAAGARVLSDQDSWQAFWRKAFPAEGEAPGVDFARFSVVAVVDDRVAYGERGAPVLTRVDPGGPSVQVVFPGVEAATAPPRRRHEITLFLAGPLPADTRVIETTLCS